MAPLERVLLRVDRFQQRHRWSAVMYAVIRKFGDDDAGSLSALIAYYGFFSVFPLILVFVTIVGFVLGAGNRIVPAVFQSIPLVGSALRTGSLQGSTFALVIGLLTSTWAGMGVMRSMQSATSRIWGVPEGQRGAGLLGKLRRSALLLVAFGVWLVATSLLSGLAASGSASSWPRILEIVCLLAVNLALYLCAFRFLPERRLSWRDVLPGAVAGAVFWTALHLLGGYYVGHQIRGASQVYGTFAIVIGLLSWLYLGAQGSLLAAELNVVLVERRWPRSLFPTAPPVEFARRVTRDAEGRASRPR